MLDRLPDCGCEGLGGGIFCVKGWDRGGAGVAVVDRPPAQGFEFAEARPGELYATAGYVCTVGVAVDSAVDAGHDGGVGGAGDAEGSGHLAEGSVRRAMVDDGALLAWGCCCCYSVSLGHAC